MLTIIKITAVQFFQVLASQVRRECRKGRYKGRKRDSEAETGPLGASAGSGKLSPLTIHT